ncbi:hypothetical protein R6Q59_009879 [Mikania micrantha]
MASLHTIPDEATFKSITTSASPSTLLVLYFQASWAAPCTQMSTVLSTLASTYPSTHPIQFLSIDAEALPDISESYDVTSVPFIVLQKANKTLDTISGSDATKVRLTVEKHAGTPSKPSANGALPAPLQVDPSAAAPTTTKDLSGYAPKPSDPQTAPEYSASTPSKEELFARLANLVKAAPVMLFMKGTPSSPQCGFSRKLVGILRENGVKYGFFNILADDDVRQGLKEYADWPTFPQLWTNGELVGGLDIVKEELENDPDFLKPFSVKQDTATAA